MLMYFMPRELDSLDSFGQTPMHLAALGGHHKVVEFLLIENGADSSKKDKNGLTPLDLAMTKKHVQCEWVLRRHRSPSKWTMLRTMGMERLKVSG